MYAGEGHNMDEQRIPQAPGERRKKISPMRRIIAERMSESLARTAQYTLTREIPVDALLDFIQERKRTGVPVKMMHVLMKVCANLLKQHEMLNARIEEHSLVFQEGVHVGVAVAMARGLLVPVIRDVDSLSLEALAERYEDIVSKARTGRVLESEMSGGTFTISNLGMVGIDAFTPIVNYPEAAILGVGRTRKMPYVDDQGSVGVRSTVIFSLTLDHRIVDGYNGALFLADLAECLSDGEKLLSAIL